MYWSKIATYFRMLATPRFFKEHLQVRYKDRGSGATKQSPTNKYRDCFADARNDR